jgi:HK97 gp10 family phage protein
LAELEENLLKLPEELAQKALGRIARKAMRGMQQKIQDAEPVKTGQLRRGIKMRSKFIGAGVEGGQIVVSIGLQRKPKDGTAFYGRFLEFGTSRKSGGPRIAARHYMENAFNASAQEVLKDFAKELGDAIEQVARKAKVKL